MAKTFILSDESVNSYGFRVLTGGIDVKQFKNNPVMFFNHRSWGENYSGPIGRWENIRVEDGKLMADAVFDETDEFAQKIAKKVEGGFIKGASIGFSAVESSVDPSVLVKGQTRPTVTRAVVFEASVVDLPSNVNALALYDSSGNLIELKSGDAEPLNQVLPIISLNKKDMNKLATATLAILCLSSDATEAQIDEAVKKLSEERDALKLKLEGIANEQIELFKNSLTAKKIKESEQLSWLELFKVNPTLAKSTLGKLSVPKLPMDNIKEEKGDVSDKAEWTLKDWREKDPAGLLKLRTDDPEAYAVLAKENLKRVTGK